MKIMERLRGAHIHMYKYVPPCPECGSFCVGRYVKEPFREEDMDYMEEQCLKYGEIVRFCESIPHDNLFCVECDHEWHGIVETKWLSKIELEQEIKRRGTRFAYEELRIEKEENASEKKKGFMRRIF